MQRVIKFRAWDKRRKEMFVPEEIVFVKNGELDVRPAGGIGDDWRTDFVLMQFTGLKDSKGKDIYEGDVVKIIPDETKILANEPHSVGFMYGDVAKVEWDDVNAKFCLFDKDGEDTDIGYYAGWSGWNWLEIIGDIYSTPELLK